MTAEALIYLMEEVRKLGEYDFVLLKKALNIVYLGGQEYEEGTDKIHNILMRFGITPNLKGYKCIKFSLEKALETDSDIFVKVTRNLYPELDNRFGGASERAIRFAIDRAEETDPELFDRIFCNKRKPTISEFLTTLAEYVKRL